VGLEDKDYQEYQFGIQIANHFISRHVCVCARARARAHFIDNDSQIIMSSCLCSAIVKKDLQAQRRLIWLLIFRNYIPKKSDFAGSHV
jgi:hypothetical protein